MKAPGINRDGEIIELDVERLDRPIQRSKRTEHGVDTFLIRPAADLTYTLETFVPKEVGFQIDNFRRVNLVIFVNEGFKLAHPARDQIIDKLVKQNAPWLFSYSKRSTREPDPWETV